MRNLLLGFIAGSVFGVAVAGGALVSAQFLDGFGGGPGVVDNFTFQSLMLSEQGHQFQERSHRQWMEPMQQFRDPC